MKPLTEKQIKQQMQDLSDEEKVMLMQLIDWYSKLIHKVPPDKITDTFAIAIGQSYLEGKRWNT